MTLKKAAKAGLRNPDKDSPDDNRVADFANLGFEPPGVLDAVQQPVLAGLGCQQVQDGLPGLVTVGRAGHSSSEIQRFANYFKKTHSKNLNSPETQNRWSLMRKK